MGVDRAVVRVLAGRERGAELGGAAVGHDLTLALAVDDDVVRPPGLVLHLDRDLPGSRLRLAGHEGELTGRAGVDLHRARLRDGGLPAPRPLDRASDRARALPG